MEELIQQVMRNVALLQKKKKKKQMHLYLEDIGKVSQVENVMEAYCSRQKVLTDFLVQRDGSLEGGIDRNCHVAKCGLFLNTKRRLWLRMHLDERSDRA